jgi:hypothetical protein
VITFAAFCAAGFLASGTMPGWTLMLVLWFVALGTGLDTRLMLGRPFAISMAALVVVLALQMREEVGARVRVAVSTACLCVGVWMHPSVWYLWLGVLGVLAWTHGVRRAAEFGGMLAAALVFAVVATWDLDTVTYPIQHLVRSLGGDSLRHTHLVSEFQPGTVHGLLLLGTVVLAALCQARGINPFERRYAPAYLVAAGTTVLGLYVVRFWTDWAVPALLVWHALLAGRLLEQWRAPVLHRSLLFCGLGAATYLGVTADHGGRFTEASQDSLLVSKAEALKPLLPDEGGVLYATDMRYFYRIFYRFPQGDWRYVLGFEPGMMPSELLREFRLIQFNEGKPEWLELWARRMTERDRMVLTRSAEPVVPGLVFRQFTDGVWVGRRMAVTGASPAAR